RLKLRLGQKAVAQLDGPQIVKNHGVRLAQSAAPEEPTSRSASWSEIPANTNGSFAACKQKSARGVSRRRTRTGSTVDFIRLRRYIQMESSGPTDAHAKQTFHSAYCPVRPFRAVILFTSSPNESSLVRAKEIHRPWFLRRY